MAELTVDLKLSPEVRRELDSLRHHLNRTEQEVGEQVNHILILQESRNELENTLAAERGSYARLERKLEDAKEATEREVSETRKQSNKRTYLILALRRIQAKLRRHKPKPGTADDWLLDVLGQVDSAIKEGNAL